MRKLFQIIPRQNIGHYKNTIDKKTSTGPIPIVNGTVTADNPKAPPPFTIPCIYINICCFRYLQEFRVVIEIYVAYEIQNVNDICNFENFV